MTNIIEIDFSKKSKPACIDDIQKLLSDTLEKTLSEHGFHRRTSKAVAAFISEQTAKDLAVMEAHLKFDFTINIEGNFSSAEEVAKAVNDQWSAEMHRRFSVLGDAARTTTILAAQTACIAMANSNNF